jgi:hypothetical protein
MSFRADRVCYSSQQSTTTAAATTAKKKKTSGVCLPVKQSGGVVGGISVWCSYSCVYLLTAIATLLQLQPSTDYTCLQTVCG